MRDVDLGQAAKIVWYSASGTPSTREFGSLQNAINFAFTRISGAEADAARGQVARLLEQAIADLPEAFRIVFMLRDVDGLSVEETAEALQIPSQTVKTRLLRARRRLQVVLAPTLQDALRGAFPFAGEACEALTERVLSRYTP